MAFNQSKKPYDNVHVRRALAYLIDRDQVTKVASPEGGTPAHHDRHPPEGRAGLDPRRAAEARSVQARRGQGRGGVQGAGLTKKDGKWLLADGKPWKVSMHAPAGFSDWMAAQENIKSQLIKAGVDAEIVTTTDYPLYLEELAAGKYDVGFWLMALGPAPYDIFQRLYGASNGWTNARGQDQALPAGQGRQLDGRPRADRGRRRGKINPGELTGKLNSAAEDQAKPIMAQLARPPTRTCRSSSSGTTSTTSSSTTADSPAARRTRATRLRLSTGVLAAARCDRPAHGHRSQAIS